VSADREAAVVTTGHSACYPTIRSLHRRGVHTIVATDADAPETRSRFCDERASLPPHDGDLLAYRDALLGLAARPDVRTILPTREVDTFLLSHHREAFERHVSVPVPTPDQLRRAHDRVRLAAAANAAGVPVPETDLVTEVADWEAERIVKSRYNLLTAAYVDGMSPSESATVKEVTHVPRGEQPDLAALRAGAGHDQIAQPYVHSSAEYMVGAIYDHGTPLATFQHRQIRGNSYVGGGGVFRRSVYIPRLETVARRLLNELDWHGLACIEYMRDSETGAFVLTEINPRLWQSLPATVRAGADFPWYYWLLATGRADEIDPGYEIGSASHLLKGELGYLASIRRDDSPHVERPPLARETLAVARSCLTDPQFDYLRLDDPGPFVATAKKALPASLGG
jgi:predicted ATP-grasp superfamily ATP-dependent carboligase